MRVALPSKGAPGAHARGVGKGLFSRVPDNRCIRASSGAGVAGGGILPSPPCSLPNPAKVVSTREPNPHTSGLPLLLSSYPKSNEIDGFYLCSGQIKIGDGNTSQCLDCGCAAVSCHDERFLNLLNPKRDGVCVCVGGEFAVV